VAVSEAAAKSHVFISYSRKDTAFADSLVAALLERGFNAYLDKKDIAPGEDWKDRLGKLIEAADTVVFLLSPDSIKSEICAWEVDEAERLSKRVLPAVCRPVVAAEVPGRLARLNWIDFSHAWDFDAALASLEQALLTDIAWLRELTRLVGLAEHWERGGRQPTQLMSQADIKATEQLLATRPQNAGLPPQSLSDFLKTSRTRLEEDIRKLRRTTGRAFVKPALQALDEGRAEHAIRLAAAGALLAEDLDLKLVTELRSPMARSVFYNRTAAVLKGHIGGVFVVSFSPDGRQIVTGSFDTMARVWEAESGTEVACLKGHKGKVLCASFGLDGRRIVTGSNDKTARVWDVESGKEIACLNGHKRGVRSALFSPDSRYIVTTGYIENSARLWTTETGVEVACLNSEMNSVNGISVNLGGGMGSLSNCNVQSAAFSPNGRLIVTGASDNSAQVWDVETGKEIARLSAHTGDVNCASFSSDSRRIVTGSDDKTARVWDVESGKEIACLNGHKRGLISASFSPNGRRIVTGSGDAVRVWDAISGKEIACLSSHTERVNSVSFNSDGSRILTRSEDTVRIWDADCGKEIARLRGHTKNVSSVSFSPYGRRVVTGSFDDTARVWDARSCTEIACLNGHTKIVWSASFSPNGQRIVTGSNDDTVRVWNVESGKAIVCLKAQEREVNSATFSPDNRWIVTCSQDNTARVWDAESGAEIARLKAHSDNVTSASFSSDGRRIVTGSADATVRVWDVESGNEILSLTTQSDSLNSVAFSPDGRRIVTKFAEDNIVQLWDSESGAEIARLSAHTGDVNCASFSSDSRRIVTGSDDKTARVWDVESGKEIASLDTHMERVNSASFSPDGRRIVTGSDDKTARVWDAETGGEIACLNAHMERVTSASFSPDGKRVMTGSWDNTARVWDVARTEAIAQDPAIVITAALARGIGWRTEDEAADLLMQDAPEDLYAAACQQLLDPAKYSADEIARREHALEETIAALHAPLHPNCYLSPTQFAEKFGLPIPGKAAQEPAVDTGDQDVTADFESAELEDGLISAEPQSIELTQTLPSPISAAPKQASHRKRRRILFGLLVILAIAGAVKLVEVLCQAFALSR
jgi:WD40 repeat protein